MTEKQIGTLVIEAAIAVHRELDQGLLETVYEVIITRCVNDLEEVILCASTPLREKQKQSSNQGFSGRSNAASFSVTLAFNQ